MKKRRADLSHANTQEKPVKHSEEADPQNQNQNHNTKKVALGPNTKK